MAGNRLTSSLILSLIDRVSGPASAISRRMTALQDSLGRNARQMDDMRGQIVDAAGAGYLLYRSLKAPITAAANFEASMNRVGAATGATGADFQRLSDLARDLGRSTQYTATEASNAIEMLAKNGLATSQIIDGALSASLSLAAASGSDMAAAADVVTDVMVNFKQSASNLKPVVNGIAGVLLQSKFGFEDYRLAMAQAGGVAGALGVKLEDFNAALAATSSAFASGSDAGTSFKSFISRLVPASKPAAKAMKKLGLEFFDGKGNMKSMAAIAEELKTGLKGLSDEARNDALNTIFGQDAVRTAILLGEQGAEGIDRIQQLIAKASADEQAAARMKGLLGAWERFTSMADDLAISVGNSLLPSLTKLLDGMEPIMSALSKFADANPKVTAAVVALAAGLIGLRVASLALRFSFLWMRGGVLSAAIVGLKGLTKVVRNSRLVFLPFTSALRSARAAMLGFMAAARIAGTGAALQMLGAGLIGLLSPIRLVVSALKLLRLAAIGTGIGAILFAIGAAGTWIYNNWSGIGEAFTAFKDTFLNAIAPIRPALDPLINGLSSVMDFLGDVLGPMESMNGKWAAFGQAAGQAAGDMVLAIVALPGQIIAGASEMAEVGRHLIQSLWDGATAKLDEMVEWVKGIPARIRKAIGNIDLSNMLTMPSFGNLFGSSSPAPAADVPQPGDGKARAKGGPVNAGHLYTVGERGKELFVPNQSGHIVPNDALQRMQEGRDARPTQRASAASPQRAVRPASTTVHVTVGDIVVQGAADADRIAREIGAKLRAELAGGHWNGGWRVA